MTKPHKFFINLLVLNLFLNAKDRKSSSTSGFQDF